MHLKAPYPHDTTFWSHQLVISEKILEDVKQQNLDFEGKTVLCMTGGVGRNADKLREIGLVPTNLDFNPEFIAIGKQRYPKTNHICYDYRSKTYIAKKFDFILWEDIWCHGYREDLYYQMYRWSRHKAQLLPNNWYNLHLYRFNSNKLDTQWRQLEPEGQLWLSDVMSKACVEIKAEFNELEDLVIEPLNIDVLNDEIHIDVSKNHTYAAIGCHQWDHKGDLTEFRGQFVNKGWHRKFDPDLGEFVNL